MSGIAFDLRSSVRYLRGKPLLALLSGGTLGIGLGVASALFAVINALYFRPLPLDREREVVVVRATNPAQSLRSEPLSRLDMVDLLGSTSTVAAFGGLRDWQFALLTNGNREPVDGMLATPGLFEVFRTTPQLGRLFSRNDDRPGNNRVALLTFASWRRRFGGDPAIIGKPLTLGGDVFTVIGVLPETFAAPSFREAEIWAPSSFDPDHDRGRALRNLTVYARLAPAASIDAFRNDLLLRSQTIAREYAETNAGWSARAIPLLEYELSAVTRQLVVLTIAVALLLAMACASIANLVFAESMSRTTEFGLRAAAGGSPLRLFRQLFLDNLLLCLVGGVTAAILAYVLLSLGAPLAAAILPRFEEIRADRALFAFTFAAAALIAAIFAAASLFWSARGEPAEHIRASGRSLVGLSSRRITAWLVGSQVGLAFVLLCLGVLYGRSYYLAATANRGFDSRDVLLVRVQALERMKRAALVTHAAQSSTELRALPGVVCTTVASSGPMFGGHEEIAVASEAAVKPAMARYTGIDRDFFTCMRIPVASGRSFTAEDDGRGSVRVAILSRGFAARLFPRGDALGKRVRVGESGTVHEIVGIAGDVDDPRETSGRGTEIYFPFAQDPRAFFFFVVRGSDARAVTASLRRSLPGFMIVSTKTLTEIVDRHLLAPRLQMALLVVFAIGAALLATVAVYGMVTLVVAGCAGEIGLRMALGATPGRTQLELLRSIAVPVVSAIVVGAAIVVVALPREPTAVPLAAAVLVVVTLTLVASVRKVRALARQEPIEALRTL